MFLVAYVFPEDFLIPTDRRYEVAPSPEALPDKISFHLFVAPRYVDGTFSFDETHYLGHCLLVRNRYHHVHMIWHQVPFFDPVFFMLGQMPQFLSQIRPDTSKYRLLPVLGNEHNVVLIYY